MSYRTSILAVALVAVVLLGGASPAAAHEWQTTVTQGPMELGISSSPADPIAGMEAEFSGRIADGEVDPGDPNRLDWGGVTNTSLEIHINGPDGVHDHVSAEVPADDAHFHFAYVFPTGGTYTISVVAPLEGEEYALQFQREVSLLPAAASGPEMDQLSSDVNAVGEDVGHLHEAVDETNEKVDETNEKVDALRTQVDSLDDRVDALGARLADADEEQAGLSLSGFGLVGVIVAVVAVVAFVAGRRT